MNKQTQAEVTQEDREAAADLAQAYILDHAELPA